MYMRFWYRVHLLLWTSLILCTGYLFGRYAALIEQVGAPEPITPLYRDIHRRAPIVHVQEISNGQIVGVVGTGGRLVMGEEVVVPRPDRSFSISADPFLVNVIDVRIPEGAVFVASRRGKKYYPVESSSAKRLAPQNRLYFRSSAEAEVLGYERGK